MCEHEYANREKNHKKYHMGLVTRQGAEKSLQNVTAEHFKQHYPVPPKPLDTSLTCKVKMYHNSIYIAGMILDIIDKLHMNRILLFKVVIYIVISQYIF